MKKKLTTILLTMFCFVVLHAQPQPRPQSQSIRLNVVSTTSNSVTYGILIRTNMVIEGAPMWNSSNVKVASLVISPNGMTAKAVKTGVGRTIISVIVNKGTPTHVVQDKDSIPLVINVKPH